MNVDEEQVIAITFVEQVNQLQTEALPSEIDPQILPTSQISFNESVEPGDWKIIRRIIEI